MRKEAGDTGPATATAAPFPLVGEELADAGDLAAGHVLAATGRDVASTHVHVPGEQSGHPQRPREVLLGELHHVPAWDHLAERGPEGVIRAQCRRSKSTD